MKSFLCILFLALRLGAAEMPDWRTLPGWHQRNQCDPFSRAFADVLNAHDLPAARLTFDWATATGDRGRHCVVLFKRDGKLWLMDNQHGRPWGPVKGRTDAEILRRYSSGFHSMVDNTTLDPYRPRTLDELFPDVSLWK